MPEVKINWGDGTADTTVTVPDGDWSISGQQHTYAARGAYLATVVGPGGGFGTSPVNIVGPDVAGAVTSAVNAGSVTSLTIPAPAGLQPGDLVVACLRGQVNTAGNTDFAGPGFYRCNPKFVSGDNNNRAISIQVRPVLDPLLEPASYTFSRSGAGRVAGCCFIVRGPTCSLVAGNNPTYGGQSYTNGSNQGRRTAAYANRPPAVQIFTGGGEFSAGIEDSVHLKPVGMTERANIVTPGDTTVSRTRLWAGTAVADAAQVPQTEIEWISTVTGPGAASASLANRDGSHLFPDVATMKAKPGATWGHRGNSTYFAEISEYAYRQIDLRGYSVMEFSAARSFDGVWFGLHDEDINRVAGLAPGTVPVASLMNWAEISSYSNVIAPDGHPQPFYRLDEFLADWAADHIVVIDPKYAWISGGTAVRNEFWAMMDALPKNHVIIKGFITTTSLSAAAKAKGYESWGYAYAADIADGDVAACQADWTILGLDWTASSADWATIKGYGKKVVAHIVNNQTDYATAISKGADLVQCGGSDQVLAVNRWTP